MLTKKRGNDFLRTTSCFKAFVARLNQERQKRSGSVNILKRQTQKQAIEDIILRNNRVLIGICHGVGIVLKAIYVFVQNIRLPQTAI